MKIGLACYEFRNGNIGFNLFQMQRGLFEARENGADMLCFGEGFLQGFDAMSFSYERDCDIAAHIDDDSFCRYVIQQDINKIAFDLREAHKDDFFSVPEDNPLEDFLQTAEETTREDSDPEQAAMAFICKRLKLNYGKLSEEEKKWLKKIAQKSDLLKNPKPQRGRK